MTDAEIAAEVAAQVDKLRLAIALGRISDEEHRRMAEMSDEERAKEIKKWEDLALSTDQRLSILWELDVEKTSILSAEQREAALELAEEFGNWEPSAGGFHSTASNRGLCDEPDLVVLEKMLSEGITPGREDHLEAFVMSPQWRDHLCHNLQVVAMLSAHFAKGIDG